MKSGFSCWATGLVLFACVAWAPTALSDTSAKAKPWPDTETPEAVSFTLPDVWPWAYESPDGTMGGSLIQVVVRLSEMTGIPVETRLRPLKRAILELRSGDANFSMLPQSPALDTEAVNIAVLAQINIVLAALADTGYPLTLDALEGKRVGFVGGTYLGEAFEQNEKVDKVPVAEISQGIEMLSLGRLTALMTIDHAIASVLKTMELEPDFLRYNVQVAGQSGVLYMSRQAQRPYVAEEFQKALARMAETNELDRIFFGETVRPGTR